MLKKCFIVFIGSLTIISAYATTPVISPNSPDKLILSLCQNLPNNFTSQIDGDLRKAIQSDPVKCANFINDLVHSYQTTSANKMVGCKSIIKFPMRGKDIISCGQEL